MTFIQVIDARSSRVDEISALASTWEAATVGRRTARRSIRAVDRNDPNHFVVMVFFDSYESAMENSSLPETQVFAEGLAALLDGPPTFHDLEVVEDPDLG